MVPFANCPPPWNPAGLGPACSAEARVRRLSDFPFEPWLLEGLQRAQTLVLMTHVGPDADGLGAQLAFARAAELAGKQVHIANEDPCPPRYAWMDPRGHILAFDPQADKVQGADLALIFDAHEVERAMSPARRAKELGVPLWVVDHHPCAADLDVQGLIAADYSSSGELVWQLIKALGWPVDAEVAAAVYAAIAFDTGSFRFLRNQARTFDVAAELLRTGMDANPIQEALFASRPRDEVILLGRVIDRVHFAAGHRIAWALLGNEVTEGLQVGGDALGELIPTLIGIEGVLIAAMVKPGRSADEWKVSLRSKAAVKVGYVMRALGGGGHDHAAGATLNGDPLPQLQAILTELEKALAEQVDRPGSTAAQPRG